MVVMRRLGQWVESAAQDSVKLAIKGRAVSNPAITDQGSSPDNGLCDIERIVDGIIGDSGGCDPGRSSCALEASSSDLDRSSCALVPPSYHLDVVRRTDSTPLCVLAVPWKFDSAPTPFYTRSDVASERVFFASLRAKGADSFHQRGSVFHYIPGRSIAHYSLHFCAMSASCRDCAHHAEGFALPSDCEERVDANTS